MEPKQTSAPLRSVWSTTWVTSTAIITGFLVSTVGIAIWTADVMIFKLSAGSILFMVVPLWLYWKFFSGAWPENYAKPRAERFRLVNLSTRAWKFGLFAALLFVVIVQASFVITFRIIPLPDSFSSQYGVIETLPKWVAWLAVVMSSLVAGICEEVGFRGYMQVPLEKRFGSRIAIVIVSVIFVLIHLDRAWALPVLPVIFCASVLLGIIACRTNSLIPGVIGHTILDVFDYSFWWTHLMGNRSWRTVDVSGLDAHFIFWCSLFLTSAAGFFWAIRKIKY